MSWRCEEPGWRLVAMHGRSGRRGVWYRATRDVDKQLEAVEVCAGREGDDAYVRLAFNDCVSTEQLDGLEDALSRGAFEADGGLDSLSSKVANPSLLRERAREIVAFDPESRTIYVAGYGFPLEPGSQAGPVLDRGRGAIVRAIEEAVARCAAIAEREGSREAAAAIRAAFAADAPKKAADDA